MVKAPKKDTKEVKFNYSIFLCVSLQVLSLSNANIVFDHLVTHQISINTSDYTPKAEISIMVYTVTVHLKIQHYIVVTYAAKECISGEIYYGICI
jgi:hypothetical protein